MRFLAFACVAATALATSGCPADVDASAPPAPSNLVAVAGNGAVFLSWDPVVDAEGRAIRYTVYTSLVEDIDKDSARISDAVSPLVDDEVQNGIRSYYAVTAAFLDAGRESPFSRVASALPDVGATAPGAVPNVVADGGPDGITIRFSPSPAVLSYTLYRGRQSGVNIDNGEAIVGVSSTYLDADVLVGERWYYVVTGTTAEGETPISREASAQRTSDVEQPPAAPATLSADASDGAVTLSWSAVAGATSYTLYFSSTAGVTPASGTPLVGVDSPHVHGGLPNDVPVFYVVTASNAAGESAPSPEATATPHAGAAPVAPVISAAAGDGRVTLTWSNVAGADSYAVFFSGAAGVSAASPAITGAQSPFLHAPLPNGTPVFYRVAAVGPGGSSPLSNEVSATPAAGLPTGHGSVSTSLTAGTSAIVLVENTTDGQGLFSVQILAGTPETGTGIDGLTASVSGPATGPLPAAGGGSYQNITPGPITPGTYVVTISGAASGTITAVLTDVPSCTVTAPTAGALVAINQDFEASWTSTHSDQAIIKVQDTSGTVTYPAVGPPDPGGAIVPGTDFPFAGPAELLVSAAWKETSTAGRLIVFGDCHVAFTFQ